MDPPGVGNKCSFYLRVRTEPSPPRICQMPRLEEKLEALESFSRGTKKQDLKCVVRVLGDGEGKKERVRV